LAVTARREVDILAAYSVPEDDLMKPTVTPSSHQEEFPYGWRYVRRGDEFEQVPLTLEDVLHPQEGDVIPVNFPHDRDCRYLAGEFESRPLSPPLGLVTHDLLVNWGVSGIGNHSPDVAVFVGLSRPLGREGTLDLRSLGGRCVVVVEVVSPNTRNNDVVHKFDHYYRVGIPLYVIIDQKDEDGPRWLRAYLHTPAGYEEVTPDGQGQILLPPLGLLLGMREDRAVCFDAVTGEEMRDHAGLKQETQRQREEALQQKEEADRAMTEQVDALRAAQRRIRELEETLRRFQAGETGDTTNPTS
jgi:Uma2 family endonuclease